MSDHTIATEYFVSVLTKTTTDELRTNFKMTWDNANKQDNIQAINSLLIAILQTYDLNQIYDESIASTFIYEYKQLGMIKTLGDYSTLIELLFNIYFKYQSNNSTFSQAEHIELLIPLISLAYKLDSNMRNIICRIALDYMQNNNLLAYDNNFTKQVIDGIIIFQNVDNPDSHLFYRAIEKVLWRYREDKN